MNLALEQIRVDGGTQSRAQLDWTAVDEYAIAMKEGEQFPPVIVFYDGSDYWLADGFHRVHAAEKAGLAEIAAEVRQGTQRDAILHSAGANAQNGVRRTKRDERIAIDMMLRDDEWVEWSDQRIAVHCAVTYNQVRYAREKASGIREPSARKYITSTGKTAFMKMPQKGTGNGVNPAPFPDADPLPPLNIPMPTVTPSLNIHELVPPTLASPLPILILNRDARYLSDWLEDGSAQLVITSPPYNVGIDYNIQPDELSTYYNLLKDVWAECHKVMADGGRICVNVPFGVGRNPWVPMALEVMRTLTDAGFTLRGQIIWDKGTTGNRTTWGSFRLPTDPGLRDTTECVIVAHKGQSNLEMPTEYRLRDEKGSYTAWLADSDYFMELAQDHWQIPPESAQRVKHPAPFPTELVRRLVHFYGFPGCHVVDPFAGSGTVGVVAKQLGCQATLFEISQDYCRLAEERINEELPVRR